jgi:hypothetical protein
MNIKNVLAFILLGVSLTLVISPLLTTKALSITTHEYCFTHKIVMRESGTICGDTKKECEEKRSQFIESSNPESIISNCFKFTHTDGNNPNKYCFDLLPHTEGKRCFDSKQECESERTAMLGGIDSSRIGSQCYKNNA